MADPRDTLFASSVPTIKVGGTERRELARDLLTLEIEENLLGLANLRFSLSAIGARPGARDEALLYLDGAIIDFGKELEIMLGPADMQSSLFKGRVSALELVMDQGKEPEVHVMAEDRLWDLRMTRRFATYEDADLSDIVQRIAGQHGLSAQVDVDTPRQKMIQQWNQTDLAFLREQAARVAGEVWFESSTIHVADRERRRSGGETVTLVQGNDLLTLSVRADLSQQRNGVTVGGYDAQAKDGIEEDADGTVVSSETAGLRGGDAILRSAFGETKSFRLRDVPLTASEARAWSRAAMTARARRFVRAEGLTTGTPKLRAGARLRLERVGATFEGEGYHVTQVMHRYDLENGYRTLFRAERAGLGTGS